MARAGLPLGVEPSHLLANFGEEWSRVLENKGIAQTPVSGWILLRVPRCGAFS